MDIKFRTWDMDRKVMLDGQCVIFYGGDYYEEYFDFEVGAALNNIVVMQYTGLKDKNDVEIYEGDIVEAYFWNDKLKPVKEKGFIGFKSGSFIFNFGDGTWEYLDGYDDIFVVGNIYENKNLLNKGAEE